MSMGTHDACAWGARSAALVLLPLLLVACERPTRYRCEADDDCGAGSCDLSTNLCVGKGPKVALTVNLTDAGGAVTSVPAGIDCPAVRCSASFPQGSVVMLRSTPAPRYRFDRWLGGCSGNAAACAVQLAAPVTIQATYVPKVCSAAGWCWENPLPQGNGLRGVVGTSSTDLWAVGVTGTVIHFDGRAWTAVDSGTSQELRAALALGNDVWIVGRQGTILRKAGSALSAVSSPVRDDLWSIWANSASSLWIGADQTRVLRWNGSAFAVIRSDGKTDPAPGPSITTGAPVGAGGAWAAGDGYVRLYDGGSWRDAMISGSAEANASQWRGAFSADGENLWIAGDLGYFLKCLNSNPPACSTVAVPYRSRFLSISATDVNSLWAAGAGGAVLAGNGASWSVHASGVSRELNGIARGGESFWAVGEGGTMAVRTGDRNEWNAFSADVSETRRIERIWGSGDDDVWAVGPRGMVLHWDGTTWSKGLGASSFTGWDLYAVWGTGVDDVWFAGNGGRIIHYDGVLPSTVESNLPGSDGQILTAIWGSGKSDVWAVGYRAGTIVHWDGVRWSQVPSGRDKQEEVLFDVWGSDASNVWAVGNYGIILRWDGSSWKSQASKTGEDLIGIWGTDKNNIWVCGRSGTLLHWDGVSWTPSASPTMGHLFRIWGSGTNDIWAAGGAGVLIHWDGKAWSPVTSGTQNDLLGLWGAGTNDVWAAGLGGTILHYQK